jgi:serine/threonine protein phosphatase PrpC
MIEIKSSGITDVGRRRKQNEDSLFYNDRMGLYVVADGMGGHKAGEVASRLVVETIREYMDPDRTEHPPENLVDADEELSEEARRLLAGIQLSNRIVHQTARSNENYKGMGSTVSAVYFTEKTFIVANVGDSGIYLIRDGKIEQLSVPHTLVAEQAELDPENAELLWGDFKHVLTRAMGVNESVKADINEIPFYRGDIIVICSDGLTDKATPEEILEMANTRRADKACRELVDLANARGGEDNITAIVLRIKSCGNHSGNFKGQLMQTLKKIFSLNAAKNV